MSTKFENISTDLAVELANQLSTSKELNDKLKQENEKLLAKFNKILTTLPNILDKFGFDGPVFVNCNLPEFLRDNLIHDTKLDETISAFEHFVTEYGEYERKSSIYKFANDIYNDPDCNSNIKWKILSYLLKEKFSKDEVLSFAMYNMRKP